MSEPFVGEVKQFSFSYVPRGWAPCDGRLLQIAQYQALYSILGITYGGDGVRTFGLPDLRGRAAVHQGQDYPLGLKAGEEAHVLTVSEIPAHTHDALCEEGDAIDKVAVGNTWGKNALKPYGTVVDSTMSTQAIGITGQGQAHSNMQPYAVTNYCIAVTGIYPSRN